MWEEHIVLISASAERLYLWENVVVPVVCLVSMRVFIWTFKS